MQAKRSWTNTGTEYNGTDAQKIKLSTVFLNLDWQPIPPSQSVPFSQGMAVKEMIKQFRLTKPTHFAYSVKSDICVIAVRNEFSNGRADIYCVDEGWQLITVATDFYPKNETVPA